MRERGSPAEPGPSRRARLRAAGPLIAITGLWAVSTLLWLQPGFLFPDGAGYFVYLPSAWIGNDLLFFDEWQAFGMIERGIIHHKDVTTTGHLGNHWTVGSALAWFPAYAIADVIRPLLPAPFPRNGLSLPYNVAVVVSSAMAGLATLLIGYSIAAGVSDRRAAAVAACAAWMATPLMWYSLVHATMSHAVSAMASALVFAAAVALRRRSDNAVVLLAGLAAGFACAVRPQNAPLVLVPLIVAHVPAARLPVYAGGAALAALPQLVVSGFLYGSPRGFLTGGGSATPFAAFQKVWTWEPLFSWYHGLFTWTPFSLVAVAGLLVLLRRDRRLASAALFVFASQWVINATMERSFWGALSFGQRRFDSCIVVFIIGAAVLFRALPPIWRALPIGLSVIWTFALFLAARASLIDLSAYIPPDDLVQAQIAAIASAGDALVPLATVPPRFRVLVGVLGVLFVVVLAACAMLVRRMPLRVAATLCSIWFAAASLFLYWCGSRDAQLIGRYADLIRRNRVLAAIPGGADVRFGLLRDELAYLQRSGRHREAEETARELMDLERRRAAALERLGLR